MEVVTLVDGLRTPLTDSDKDKRRTGVEILSLVLSQLPINILNTTEITFLTEYYCGCLLDHHSMIPAILKGVLALVSILCLFLNQTLFLCYIMCIYVYIFIL